MKTTATHRALAHQYAESLQWRKAAYHMKEAIALYPVKEIHRGSLAERDIARMSAKARAWDDMADDMNEPVYIGEWDSDGRTLVDPEF